MHSVFRFVGIGSFVAIALMTSACQQKTTAVQPPDIDVAEQSEPAPYYWTILGIGHLQYVDELLMQRERATGEHRQEAATFLDASLKMAAEDKASNFEKGYEGLVKMHCPSVTIYPTNDALIVCAESELVSDLQATSRVNRFRLSARMYHAMLDFSEAVDEPLSAQQRQAVETNISCLDAFLANAVTPSPTCELVFTTLQ